MQASKKHSFLRRSPLAYVVVPLAFVLVWVYNGQRGACSPLQKKAFYWFYPVHLLVLAGITNLLL